MTHEITDFSMNMFSLKGKTAIVTGANQNLGMAYAVAFAKAGADLYIPHFTDETDTIRKLIEAEGRKVSFLKGDLTKDEDRKAVVKGCLDTYGKIDILVNNAGMGVFCDFLDFPDSAWQKVIDINMNAVYYLSHEVAKVMVKQGHGKIINIASALSFTADKKCPPYVASKHAIVGITRTFANELGEHNIQTNAIAPGFYQTEINKAISDDKAFYDKITGRIPAGDCLNCGRCIEACGENALKFRIGPAPWIRTSSDTHQGENHHD